MISESLVLESETVLIFEEKKKIPVNSQVITVLKSDFYQNHQLLSFTQPSESYDQGH